MFFGGFFPLTEPLDTDDHLTHAVWAEITSRLNIDFARSWASTEHFSIMYLTGQKGQNKFTHFRRLSFACFFSVNFTIKLLCHLFNKCTYCIDFKVGDLKMLVARLSLALALYISDLENWE